MLTKTTTRTQYLQHLRQAVQLTPSNSAIANHLAKVETMGEKEWKTHRTSLLSLRQRSATSVKRMVREASK